MACEGHQLRPHSRFDFDGATLPGVGAVGFSGVDLRRRALLMPAHDSPRGAAWPDMACRPGGAVKSTVGGSAPTYRSTY